MRGFQAEENDRGAAREALPGMLEDAGEFLACLLQGERKANKKSAADTFLVMAARGALASLMVPLLLLACLVFVDADPSSEK
jgi:hypothetical protein